MSTLVGSVLYLVLFLLVLYFVDRLAARVPEDSAGETEGEGSA